MRTENNEDRGEEVEKGKVRKWQLHQQQSESVSFFFPNTVMLLPGVIANIARTLPLKIETCKCIAQVILDGSWQSNIRIKRYSSCSLYSSLFVVSNLNAI